MMLYFNKDLVEDAKRIMSFKGTKDDIEAFGYYEKVNDVLYCYCYDTQNYNADYAINLDNEVRQKYFAISYIENYPVNTKASISGSQGQSSNEPEEIRRLNVDLYGIMFDVLYKHGRAKILDDFLK